MPDDASAHVTVFRTRDPVELDAVVGYLRAEGLAPRPLGTSNAALVGAGQHIFGLRIEVPADEVEAAREALAAFEGGTVGVAAADLPDELRPDPDEGAAPEPAPRRKRVVVALAAPLVLPGGAHWYAARPWTASVIALGEVGAFAALLSYSWVQFMAGVVALAALVLFDLVAGLRAARRYDPDGRGPGRGRQLVSGLLALALAAGLAALAAPRIPEPKAQDAAPVFLLPEGTFELVHPLRLDAP